MMTMKINLDIKFAVVQFGNINNEELIEIAKEITKEGVRWYVFDETADREFELDLLREHYDIIYECIDKSNFVEIKR